MVQGDAGQLPDGVRAGRGATWSAAAFPWARSGDEVLPWLIGEGMRTTTATEAVCGRGEMEAREGEDQRTDVSAASARPSAFRPTHLPTAARPGNRGRVMDRISRRSSGLCALAMPQHVPPMEEIERQFPTEFDHTRGRQPHGGQGDLLHAKDSNGRWTDRGRPRRR